MLAVAPPGAARAAACDRRRCSGLTRLQRPLSATAPAPHTPSRGRRRDRCHTLHSPIHSIRAEYSDKRRLRVGCTWWRRRSATWAISSARARDTLRLVRPHRGRGHAAHRDASEALRHLEAACVPARAQRGVARGEIIERMRGGASASRWSATRARRRISDPGFDLVRAVRGGGHRDHRRSGSLCGDRRAVDRGAADGSILLRGILAGAPSRAAHAARSACARNAHPGVLRVAASGARDARGLRARRSAPSAPPRLRAKSPSCTRRSIAVRCASAGGAAAAERRFRRGRNRAGRSPGVRGSRRRDGGRTAMAARSTARSKMLLAELPLKQAAHLAAQHRGGSRQRGL